jgi:hypothetical protein
VIVRDSFLGRSTFDFLKAQAAAGGFRILDLQPLRQAALYTSGPRPTRACQVAFLSIRRRISHGSDRSSLPSSIPAGADRRILNARRQAGIDEGGRRTFGALARPRVVPWHRCSVGDVVAVGLGQRLAAPVLDRLAEVIDIVVAEHGAPVIGSRQDGQAETVVLVQAFVACLCNGVGNLLHELSHPGIVGASTLYLARLDQHHATLTNARRLPRRIG